MSNSKHWFLTISGGADGDPGSMRAGVDLALAAGAFGQEVTLVFSGHALNLLAQQPLAQEPLYRLLGSLPYYDIDQVFALNEPEQGGAYRNDLSILPLNPRQWCEMMSGADIAINY